MSTKGNAESFIELRGSLSLPGAIQGKSAYEIAVMHGFDGTEEEYVQWLKYGKDGEDGADGITPHIGENGNWWIGDKDTGVASVTPVPYTFGTTDLVEGKSELPTGHLYFVYDAGFKTKKVTVTMSHGAVQENGANVVSSVSVSMLDDGKWYKGDETILIGDYEGGGAIYKAMAYPYVMYNEGRETYDWKFEIVEIIMDTMSLHSVGEIITSFPYGTYVTIEDAKDESAIGTRVVTVSCPASAAYAGDTGVTVIEMADDGKEYRTLGTVPIGEYFGGGMCNRGKAMVLVKYNKTTKAYDYRYLMVEVTSDAGVVDMGGELWEVGKIYTISATVTLTDLTE